MVDIFDLKSIEDLPTELRNELSITATDKFAKELLHLFDISSKGRLSIDELTVGYYRHFKKVKPRQSIHVKLYNMSRSPKYKLNVVKGKRGIYELAR